MQNSLQYSVEIQRLNLKSRAFVDKLPAFEVTVLEHDYRKKSVFFPKIKTFRDYFVVENGLGLVA